MQQQRAQLTAALADRYRIERELGAGGMATVYLAHDLKHDREVAIKVLREELSASLGKERFLREIQLVAKLSHPHILPLFDSGEANGALFFVMPNVKGESLRDRLDAEGTLPVHDAVRIAQEVASALDHAHRHDVVHRDIKPENIMLQDGHALVADFGIGKALSETDSNTLTQAGASVGTPAYMSPEQAVGETVDGRSDLYSLGCVLYEMLAGEPPFTGPNVQAVIAKRFVQIPADICALREGVPRSIARALQRALQRTPMDRPGTAAELLTALRVVESTNVKAANAPPAQSIAVLPFENLSTDRENEFFGDGIAEDIIGALTRVAGLHVAAKTSAFSFKGKRDVLATIGETLHVATVLQGSVRRAGNRVRISVQLVSVTDGYHLWSERYDRELVDVFVVQDEIAGAIAARLELTLRPLAVANEQASPAQVQAYDLITEGRSNLAKRGVAVIYARTAFERAIALDPNNALAHAMLGDAIRLNAQYGFISADEGLRLGKAPLERALELDPNCAEAIGTLGMLSLNFDAQPKRAIPLLERSLALNPRQSELRALYAHWGLINTMREDARGLEELARAVRDDPLSSFVAVVHGVGLCVTGRYDEAKAEVRRGIALDAQAFAGYAMGTFIYAWANDPEGTFEIAERGMQLFGRHPWLLQELPGMYLLRGDRRRAEAIYDELKARAITSNVPHYSLAVAALRLGHVDEGLREAQLSATLRDAIGPIWARTPGFESLREHPGFQQVLQNLGMV
ncbi:protein kinase domain-containing protein [Gemmatimonas sp.]|uniref:protein kinase domain-containing protein n=1 Tax=Gemmatimonas sp. TaxID=1962908 RepID=UPI003982EF34